MPPSQRILALCTWSLANNLQTLRALRDQTPCAALHANLDPVLSQQHPDFIDNLIADGWHITATMVGFAQEDYRTLASIRHTGGIVPDHAWPVNHAHVLQAIDLTASLNVPFLTFHFGFIDPADATIAARIKELADAAADRNVTLLMETGQEPAPDLHAFLTAMNHPALGVNFDPANMILYGSGDPLHAVHLLAPWIHHVHIKDALPSPEPGQWGREVPWGQGNVNHTEFLRALDAIDYQGPLAIEREGGDQRLPDIIATLSLLQKDE